MVRGHSYALMSNPQHRSKLPILAHGCAPREPGIGDSLPPGWMPIGIRPRDGPPNCGKPLEPPPKPAEGGVPGRSHLPWDQFEFDQKFDATAWRLAGELLNRARRPDHVQRGQR